MFENEEGDEVVPETPVEPAAPADTWDGDFAKLDAQPWWSTVPETARTHITSAHEARTAAESRASYLDRLFSADDTLVALRTEHETTKAELEGLKKALEGKDTEVTTYRSRAEALEARIAEEEANAEADREFAAMQAKYPDVFADVYYTADKSGLENKGAYMRFLQLRGAGIPDDEAAVMARALLPKGGAAPAAQAAPAAPAPKPPREVVVPKAIAAATPGGNTPQAVVSLQEAGEDYDTRKRRIVREEEDRQKAR